MKHSVKVISVACSRPPDPRECAVLSCTPRDIPSLGSRKSGDTPLGAAAWPYKGLNSHGEFTGGDLTDSSRAFSSTRVICELSPPHEAFGTRLINRHQILTKVVACSCGALCNTSA